MFRVKSVISGEELEVEPRWEWKGWQGSKVIVFGYKTPKPGMYGYEFAKDKLNALLVGKQIELFAPEFHPSFGYEKLVCRVYLDGIDVSNYFPEFKNRQYGFLE